MSVVTSYHTQETQHFSPREIIEWVRTGNGPLADWSGQIRMVRALLAEGKNEQSKEAKKRLPLVFPSGTFKKNEKPVAGYLIEHSGLVGADVDHLGERLPKLRKELERSQFVYALFVSPSGDGLKVWFRVPPDAERHYESFLTVQHYLKEVHDVELDEKCKDMARKCFLSYDPDAYLNEEAQELQPRQGIASRKPNNEHPPLSEAEAERRQEIAANLCQEAIEGDYEDIDWEDAETGYCSCPFEHLHTNSSGFRDLQIKLNGVPNAYCFHESCKPQIGELNVRLREECDRDPEIERLAELSDIDYERQRKEFAKARGIRASALDRAVTKARGKQEKADDLQGSACNLAEIEPWEEEVNAAETLDGISQRFTHYASLPPGATDALALWCAHAHCFNAFTHSPRLNITAPEKGCGKTTVRNVVALFVPKPVLAENMTTAVLFRMVDLHAPTVLADEYDTWLMKNEELRGLLNSGHARDGVVLRCVGDEQEVRSFKAFSPVVLCGIGALPGTLHDRSIVVKLERAKRGELPFRFDPRRVDEEKILCKKLARFAQDARPALEACDPQMPESAYNRVADNWRPLFAIAEIAGGQWPARCEQAFELLTGTAGEEEMSLRTELLNDIRRILRRGFTASDLTDPD